MAIQFVFLIGFVLIASARSADNNDQFELYDPIKSNCHNVNVTDLVNREDYSSYIKCLWIVFYGRTELKETTATEPSAKEVSEEEEEDQEESSAQIPETTTKFQFRPDSVKLGFRFYKKDKDGNYA